MVSLDQDEAFAVAESITLGYRARSSAQSPRAYSTPNLNGRVAAWRSSRALDGSRTLPGYDRTQERSALGCRTQR